MTLNTKRRVGRMRVIADIYHSSPATESELKYELISKSFYLPLDMMNDERYDVRPIRIIEHPSAEWDKTKAELDTLLTTQQLVFCDHPLLLKHARKIALSTRTDRGTGETFNLLKVYFPKQELLTADRKTD